MSLAALNKRQFSGVTTGMSAPKKDPSSRDKHDHPRFTGAGGSKTMYVMKGHMPKPPATHPHHHHAGKRTRRAR